MRRGDVDRWLAEYIEAWRTYERERIAALFGDDAEYRYHPYDEPLRGRRDRALVARRAGHVAGRGRRRRG